MYIKDIIQNRLALGVLCLTCFHLEMAAQAVVMTDVNQQTDTVNVERYDDANLKPLIGRTSIVPFFNKEGTKFWYGWQDYGDSKQEYHVYEQGKGKYTIADTKDFEKRTYPKINPYGTSPDSLWCLSEDSLNNLLLENLQTHERRQLTTDGATDLKFEIIDTHWLDSDYFIIMRKDGRKVRKFSLTYSLNIPPQNGDYVYELPGDSVVETQQLYLGNLKTGSFQLLDTHHYRWQQLRWQKAEGVTDRVFFWRFKRSREEAELCMADTLGEVHMLISEVSRPRINPDMFACHIVDGKHIFLWSDRTGWGHYYHYDINGKLLNAVTQGDWTCGRIISIDAKHQQLFFDGYGREKGRNPNYCHVYRVGFNGKGIRLLTPEDANHHVFIGPERQLVVDVWSRINLPPTVCVRDRDGKLLQELEHTDISRLTAYGWKCPEPIQLTAADGKTPLYGIMWKPFDFDPSKKYPVISQVYPGPFTETVWNDFTVFDKYHNGALAQRGFIVVVFGHRGSSPYRGKKYYDYGYGNLRDYPLADDVAGLRDLFRQYSFIDSTRVGIVGHSGGAMMAATAIMTYPDFYKAAVASSGNYDNRIYNRNWGENYQGISEDGHFEVKTVMELAPRLKGKLLIVTGDRDQNVHPAHTQRLVESLIQANKDFELLILPGQEHHYDFRHEQYFERRKRDFFERALKPSAQYVEKQPTDSVAPLVLQILKFPDGSTMMTHSGEIVASDLCGLDVVDSIHLAEKYVPYLKNEKSAMVFWVAKGAEPFLTLSDILKVYNIKKYETDIVKLNNLRLQESELEPLFSKNNIHSVQKTGNVISIITKHHLMREEAKRQGKPHYEIDKIAPRNEFWPTENDMKHREELKKR